MPGIRLIATAGHPLYELLEPEKVSACSALELLSCEVFEFLLIIAGWAAVATQNLHQTLNALARFRNCHQDLLPVWKVERFQRLDLPVMKPRPRTSIGMATPSFGKALWSLPRPDILYSPDVPSYQRSWEA